MPALLSHLAEVSRRVAATRSRKEKVALLAAFLRRLDPTEVPIAVAYLSGELPQGRIGVGWATLKEARDEVSGAVEAPLTLVEVDRALAAIGAISGGGSKTRRVAALRELLAAATEVEQEWLTRLLLGDLRQGALEALIVEAVARAAEIPLRRVRRAAMVAGDSLEVAAAALAEGPEALSRFTLTVLTPVLPMLAQPADTVDEVLERLGEAAFEHKLDGARIQVHKAGSEVRVFTRSLSEVSRSVPEVVEATRSLAVREAILDGEVLALGADGSPRPFQVTMRRFGRKLDVARVRQEVPLTPFFFDCLLVDGESLIDRPTAERAAALADSVPEPLLIPRLVTGEPAAARAFLEEAVRRGHEGVMAKSLGAAYQAGSRGSSWMKLKPVHTLDLVVLGAEWGSGRRRGWLSNLHLGARDPVGGGFVMLGKTFKGMTDWMLAWQTERLLELEVSRDGSTVWVRPELVVEVAFNELQESPHYPGGLALRFARIKRYRTDKPAGEADTMEAVRVIHHGSRR